MKWIALGLVAALVGGCGQLERSKAYYLGHSTICVDGVNYIQFTSGVTVKYNKDGTVSVCK